MSLSAKVIGSYGIRGIYPEEINEEMAYRIGRAFPSLFKAKKVVAGHDGRLSGPSLADALKKGLSEAGCDVMDIDLCGTEMISFAAAHYHLDGGIMITAEREPKMYNGMKFVQEDGHLLAEQAALQALVQAARSENPAPSAAAGKVEKLDIMDDYIVAILSSLDLDHLKPFKVIANTLNGAAGPVINAIEKKLPFDIVKIHNISDGSFPNGVPDPMLPETRQVMAELVRKEEADLGVAWTGDFSSCCLFDEAGNCLTDQDVAALPDEASAPEPDDDVKCLKETSGMLPWLKVMAVLSGSEGKKLSDLGKK